MKSNETEMVGLDDPRQPESTVGSKLHTDQPDPYRVYYGKNPIRKKGAPG